MLPSFAFLTNVFILKPMYDFKILYHKKVRFFLSIFDLFFRISLML